jgi:hypothetical protein
VRGRHAGALRGCPSGRRDRRGPGRSRNARGTDLRDPDSGRCSRRSRTRKGVRFLYASDCAPRRGAPPAPRTHLKSADRKILRPLEPVAPELHAAPMRTAARAAPGPRPRHSTSPDQPSLEVRCRKWPRRRPGVPAHASSPAMPRLIVQRTRPLMVSLPSAHMPHRWPHAAVNESRARGRPRPNQDVRSPPSTVTGSPLARARAPPHLALLRVDEPVGRTADLERRKWRKRRVR